MVIRMRHTKGHTRNRRSHHALKNRKLTKCDNCDSLKERHKMCQTCGKYKGRVVVNVLAKVEKKEKKASAADKKEEETTNETVEEKK
jgi:large subunit ribosomal protein L32